MIAHAIKQVKIAGLLLGVFTILTGILYPAVVTVFAQLLFPTQANGSIILQNQKPIGSLLIGQEFTSDKYFWGRPSATVPNPYNTVNSAGSNLGPSNPILLAAVKSKADALRKANPNATMSIPVDLVTASGSGLDPEISIRGAYYQVARIATARKISNQTVYNIIKKYSQRDSWLTLSASRINVLRLNIALDQLAINRETL